MSYHNDGSLNDNDGPIEENSNDCAADEAKKTSKQFSKLEIAVNEYMKMSSKKDCSYFPNKAYQKITTSIEEEFLEKRIEKNKMYVRARGPGPEMVGRGKYKIGITLGAGSFGRVFMGQDIETGVSVACKWESPESKYPQLKNEAKLYQYLQGKKGVPKVYWCGHELSSGLDGNWVVMEMLGPSLDYLHHLSNNKFSLKTVLMLGSEMISILEGLHSFHIIHRDLKDANFCIGRRDNSNKIYILDFGLAKMYEEDFFVKKQTSL